MQKTLSTEQIKAFHHSGFVEDQVRDFMSLVGAASDDDAEVLDVGGGCGFFAQRLNALTGRKVRVMDTDPESVDACRRAGVEATIGDALQPQVRLAGGVITLNLILHHLVGRSERVTRGLQAQALGVWRNQARAIFVNEYIYESYFGTLSGWMIFLITRNPLLSLIGRMVATIAPSLKANTFGVGVRFRAHREWLALFEAAGFAVKSTVVGADEPISAPRRLLLIKHIRRDSFLLEPRKL